MMLLIVAQEGALVLEFYL